MNKKAFGQRLRFLRKLEHLTQAKLAESLDITVEHLSNLERGASAPSFELIIKLSEALGTTPANLFLFVPFQLQDESPEEGAPADSLDWRGYVSRIGSFDRDLRTGESNWSESLLEIFGLSPTTADRNLDLILKQVIEDDRASFLESYQRVLEGKSQPPVTFRFRRRDGILRLGLIQAEIERNTERAPVRIFGLIMDITEQKRMEQSLVATHHKMEQRVRDRTRELQNTVRRLEATAKEQKKAESQALDLSERLRHILDSITDGYFEHHVPTGKSFYSPSWGTMLGFAPNELGPRNVPFLELIHPEDRNRVMASFAAQQAGSSPTRRAEDEFRLRAKDGSWRWILARAHVVERNAKGTPVRIVGVHTDITDLKKALAALEKSEARLLRAQKLARVGYWEVDSATGRLWWSDNLYRLFGYEPDEILLTMEFFLGHVHPNDMRRVLDEHARVRRDKDQYAVEYRYHCRDGEVRHGRSRADLVLDDKGKVLRLAGAFQDITEYKNAEQAVRQSQEHYRLLAEHSADLVWTMDADHRYTYHSPSCERVYGYTQEEIMSMPLEKRLTPESMEMVRRIIQERRTSGPGGGVNPESFTFELDQYGKDGRLIRTEVNTAPMFDGKGEYVGVVGVSRDITKRRQAEQELRASQERLQHIFRNAPLGITRAALDGTLLEVNDAFACWLGYRPNELVGTRFQDITHPEDQSENEALRRDSADGKTEGYQMVKRYLHKDGRVRRARVFARRMIAPDDKPCCFLAMVMPLKDGEDEHGSG